MATVIDALVVQLGLDSKQFQQGIAKLNIDLKVAVDNTNQSAKKIEASGKQAAQFFSRLRNEALMFFGVLTGARSIKQFVENITASDANLGRLAKTLNMSVEDLSAWTSAVQRSGGSADAAAGTLSSLEDNLQELATTGHSSLLPFFASMGIAMLDSNHKARPLKDILLDIAKWAEGKDPAMVTQRLRSMGFDQGTINMLLKGKDAVQGLLAESERLGVVNKEDAAAAEARQKAWRDLEQAATSLARTVLTAVSPAIQQALDWLDKWIQANRPEIAATITRWVISFRDTLIDVFKYLQNLDWTSIRQAAGSWIDDARTALLQFFQFLKDNWPEIKRDVGEVADGFKNVASAIGTVANGINDFINGTVGWKTAAEIFFAAWAVGKFMPILGVLTRMSGLAGGLLGVAGKSGGGGGLLTAALLGRTALYATIANATVDAADPNDKIGTWVDQNLPGAGYLDDLAARYTGFGRTFDEQQKAAAAAGYTQPRGIRNNNPLNLEYRPGQGAASSDGRFGVYSDMEGGVAAASRQLLLYQDRDRLNTIKGIISKWAPPSDHNDTAGYIKQVSDMLKVDPDQQIDLHDPNMMAALIIGMGRRESGKILSPDVVLRGVNRAMPNQSIMRNPVADLNTGAAASPATQTSTTNTTNTSTSDVKINGPINVQTQATDAKGIADSISSALRNSFMVQQADGGLN